MARESCNLDKDEAEIIKPTSSPPSPSSSSPPSPLFIKPSQEFPASSDSPPPPNVRSFELHNEAQASHTATGDSLAAAVDETTVEAAEKYVNRCSSCRKRVGLTGFRCRCGQLFCPCHRYSETHDCSFDYKVVGRAEIAKANPVVRAAKIIKI